MEHLDRITQFPEMMGGKACIRGMRVTVGMILGQIGSGHSIDEVLADYPYLEREDVLQALRYAAWLAEERRNCSAWRMKLLIDMNLSPRWVSQLRKAGFGADAPFQDRRAQRAGQRDMAYARNQRLCHTHA